MAMVTTSFVSEEEDDGKGETDPFHLFPDKGTMAMATTSSFPEEEASGEGASQKREWCGHGHHLFRFRRRR